LTGDFMEKIVKVAQLFDIYGPLLNEKQRDVINSYYNEDLSLQEIADNTQRSKQAISDMINRSVEKLFEFEDELSLFETKQNLKDSLFLIKELMDDSNYTQANDEITRLIEKI
ncbi:MAG: DNA-binding protein, partial [Anaerococcus sp.]|nr:DNA-binding protein [Anaerococcus sp.]